MSDFKAKIGKIRFPPGLCTRPRWGNLQRSPIPPAIFKGSTSNERAEKEGDEVGEEKGEGNRRGRKEEGESEGWTRRGASPQILWPRTAPAGCLLRTKCGVLAGGKARYHEHLNAADKTKHDSLQHVQQHQQRPVHHLHIP